MGGDSTNDESRPRVLRGPTDARVTSDPGDATARNYRYQYAYGVMLLVAAALGLKPYHALWCEQHEDFLAQRHDGIFDGYQIKTARPELGAWSTNDREFTKSVCRFVDLVAEFGAKIGRLFFVSNTEFDEVGAHSTEERRRGRCPRAFLKEVRNCSASAQIAPPFKQAFDEMQATCGCDAEQLLDVLHRVDLVLGPSRGEFDASLAHEHIALLDDCKHLAARALDQFRDDLVAIVARASSLHVTDPIRHLRPLVDATDIDPTLTGKRLIVSEVVRYHEGAPRPAFSFVGEPGLKLGAGQSWSVLGQKLAAADLSDQVEYMRERARGAEYSLLEDAVRKPDTFAGMLRQIEGRVHGEVSEAYLRARGNPHPYGRAMLVEVQERLVRVAAERSPELGGHGYDCLVGVAAMLTDECRAWWGPRFSIKDDT